MKIFIILLFVSVSLLAQVEYSGEGPKSQYLPKFFIDMASYESQDSGKSKMDVFIKVPYSNIQFLKTDNGYRAKYSITVSLYDEDDDILKLEKLWNEKVETKSFKQTSSAKNFNVSYKSFVVDPGKYKFTCKLEDVNSRKFSVYEQIINVSEYDDSIGVSGIVLVSEFIETNDGTKIIPNISNRVTSRDSSISFFYEIYSDETRQVDVSYAIIRNDGEALYSKENTFRLEKGKNEINETLDNIVFNLGDYKLEVKLLDEDFKMIKGSGKLFSSKIFGFPPSISDLDLAVKQMQYIATPDEIDVIQDQEVYTEKLKRYLVFWKKLDPSPNTIENETLNEYYRRIEYANASFKGYFKGWRSDMGMVYVTLGAPDQVTRRPYEMDSKPYEVWSYYVINRSFVFVDQTNFGDYRLQNPAYGDWFRYRP